MMVTIIVGVLAATGFLIWILWLFGKFAERTERDHRFRRRILLAMATLYGSCALIAVVQVATRKEPVQVLFGLPISALFVWVYLRQAGSTK